MSRRSTARELLFSICSSSLDKKIYCRKGFQQIVAGIGTTLKFSKDFHQHLFDLTLWARQGRHLQHFAAK
jgi:hypothetical protein